MRQFSINDFDQFIGSLEYLIGNMQSYHNEISFHHADIRSTFFVDMESVIANYVQQFNLVIISHYLLIDFVEKYRFPFIKDLSDQTIYEEIEIAYNKLGSRLVE